jgi:hypothetical protein
MISELKPTISQLSTQWRGAKARFEKKDGKLLKEYDGNIDGLLLFVRVSIYFTYA